MGSILQMVRGAALGGLLAGAVWAIVLFVGLAPGANRIFLVVLAVLGIGYYMIPPGDRRLAATGAAAMTALAAISGLSGSYGWLEAALTVGGVLAAGWIISGRDLDMARLSPGHVSLALVALVIVALIPLIVGGETFGHDESAYALKARSWLEGTPDSGWSIHRGPALSGFEYLVLAAGGDEPWMRSSGLLGLAGLSAATWWLGARTFVSTVGALSALVVLAGPSMLMRATEALTDIPAAALLVACMGVLWGEFERRDGGPTYRILWVLPLAWAAFYLRYQSILAFGLVGLAMLIVWWPRIRARPGPVVVTGLVGVVGLIPHALHATSELGSPVGILRATGEVAGRQFLGEGLFDYALQLGWPLGGLMGLPVVVFFLWWAARAWSTPGRRKLVIFLALPALGQVLILGIVSHGEPRFVFFPLALVAIGAVAGAIDVTGNWNDAYRVGVRVTLVALLFSSIAISLASTRSGVEHRASTFEPIELAAELVEDIAGPDCAILTSSQPQVTFYSECFTDRFRPELAAMEAIERLGGMDKYMILIGDDTDQAEGDDLSELIGETAGQPIVLDTEGESATIYEFED